MRDTIREHWLTDKGYTWEYIENIVLADIRIDEGVRRQIRLSNEIDQDHVNRLVMALSDGAKLPAVLLATIDRKYELIDGIHRLTAMQHKGIQTTDGYLLTNVKDRVQLEQARRLANAPVGKGFSTEEAIQQALALVLRANWAPKEAARAMSVAHESITRRLRTIASDERMAKVRPKADLSKLSVQTRDFLGRIQNEEILGESIDVVLNRKLTGPMVEEIFKDAITITSDAEAARFREKLQEAYPIEKRPRFPSVERTPEWNVDNAVVQLKRAISGLDKRATYFNQLKEEKRKSVAGELQRLGAEILTRAANLTVNGGSEGVSRKRTTRQSGRSQAARQ